MSDHSTVATTDLTSQYVAQVANDLERNSKEQERVSAEIAELQGQLAALQRDHALLVKMQQALDLAAAPAGAAAPVVPAADAGGGVEPASVTESSDEQQAEEPAEKAAVSGQTTVPAPRGRSGLRSGAGKPKRSRKKVTAGTAAKAEDASSTTAGGTSADAAKPARATSARKPATAKPAEKASAVKAPRRATASAKTSAPAKGDAPKLVDLVRRHLDEQNEPRSAAEVAAALGAAHPGRAVKVTVVRSTLEGLVARNQAQRTKQGTSVFYTAPDGGTPAPERASDART
ncbi:hypothetical protein C1708_30450 [Streptomyces sp. DH-12]|uniref:hypothetical protein n=1 Tax=Streptomyces sp. DH-12 TaxID=2072509 RepID=UPI000CCF176B|nr:hypothetical protein [Streptomyces sp. DH-12]PNV36103.1 hypothetical protein C1708_30450 [Streptomyces sp. DH-12]